MMLVRVGLTRCSMGVLWFLLGLRGPPILRSRANGMFVVCERSVSRCAYLGCAFALSASQLHCWVQF